MPRQLAQEASSTHAHIADGRTRSSFGCITARNPRPALVIHVVVTCPRACICDAAVVDSADVKAFFERVSTNWDDMRSSFYNADVIDALALHGRVDASSRVVDVGTGTGFVAVGLASRAGSVTGVDNSAAMLTVAADNIAACGLGNVSFVSGEIDRLPLDNDSVDAAVANMVLHHAPDPAAMLTEMARVVRPGGAIAITDEIEHDYEWMRTEQADLWLGFTPDQVRDFFGQARLQEYGYTSLGMQ
jgi:ubiquinone/menaquinone biosynthesis C-methylase UbiE